MGAQLALQTLGSAYAVNSPPRYHDDGSGGKLLRPENQVAKTADPTDLPTALSTGIAIRNALITAGIMKAA